jgi:hypothetical protein
VKVRQARDDQVHQPADAHDPQHPGEDASHAFLVGERSTEAAAEVAHPRWPRYVELLNHPGTPLDSDPSFETYDVDGAVDAIIGGPALARVPLAVMSKTEPFAISPTAPQDVVARVDA